MALAAVRRSELPQAVCCSPLAQHHAACSTDTLTSGPGSLGRVSTSSSTAHNGSDNCSTPTQTNEDTAVGVAGVPRHDSTEPAGAAGFALQALSSAPGVSAADGRGVNSATVHKDEDEPACVNAQQQQQYQHPEGCAMAVDACHAVSTLPVIETSNVDTVTAASSKGSAVASGVAAAPSASPAVGEAANVSGGITAAAETAAAAVAAQCCQIDDGAPPVTGVSILTELDVSFESLQRLLTGDCRVETQQPVWMVVNLQGKIKGSYSATKMLEFGRRGTLSANQLILGIDKDLPYVSRQELGFYRPFDEVLTAVHQGGVYTPLTQHAVASLTQQGLTPAQWQPVCKGEQPAGACSGSNDAADSSGNVSSAAHLAAVAAAAQLHLALEKLCGGSSAAGLAADDEGSEGAVDGPVQMPPSGSPSPSVTCIAAAGQRAAAVAAGGSDAGVVTTPVAEGVKQQPMWLYINHLGWCRGPFPGDKMVQAHLCGRLPRDTLVVCHNPELPPSLLCMDVAYFFRPFGVLLDNVARGWRYQPVDWGNITNRGLIRAAQQQQQQQGTGLGQQQLPAAIPQAWTPLVWEGPGQPVPLVDEALLQPPKQVPTLQQATGGASAVGGAWGPTGAGKAPRRRRAREQFVTPPTGNLQQQQQQQVHVTPAAQRVHTAGGVVMAGQAPPGVHTVGATGANLGPLAAGGVLHLSAGVARDSSAVVPAVLPQHGQHVSLPMQQQLLLQMQQTQQHHQQQQQHQQHQQGLTGYVGINSSPMLVGLLPQPPAASVMTSALTSQLQLLPRQQPLAMLPAEQQQHVADPWLLQLQANTAPEVMMGHHHGHSSLSALGMNAYAVHGQQQQHALTAVLGVDDLSGVVSGSNSSSSSASAVLAPAVQLPDASAAVPFNDTQVLQMLELQQLQQLQQQERELLMAMQHLRRTGGALQPELQVEQAPVLTHGGTLLTTAAGLDLCGSHTASQQLQQQQQAVLGTAQGGLSYHQVLPQSQPPGLMIVQHQQHANIPPQWAFWQH